MMGDKTINTSQGPRNEHCVVFPAVQSGAASEDALGFVVSQECLGLLPPGKNHKKGNKQEKKLYKRGEKENANTETKVEAAKSCDESKEEEKTTEDGEKTAVMTWAEIVAEDDENRRNQEEVEDREYDELQRKLYAQKRGDYWDPNVYQDSSGDDCEPQFIHDDEEGSPGRFSGSYSPGSSVGNPKQRDAASQMEEEQEDEAKDMSLDSIKLEEMEVVCAICENQLKSLQAVMKTSQGLVHKQCWRDMHEDGEELCSPCCVAGVQVPKPPTGVKCPSCEKRETKQGVENLGEECVVGECSPKVTVFKPMTACSPCRDSMHEAGSQQLTIISSLDQEAKEMTGDEEVAFMEASMNMLQNESEEEEEPPVDKCVACGDNLLAGLTILTGDGPLHVSCWEKTPAGREAKKRGDPQNIYNDPRQPQYGGLKEKCVQGVKAEQNSPGTKSNGGYLGTEPTGTDVWAQGKGPEPPWQVGKDFRFPATTDGEEGSSEEESDSEYFRFPEATKKKEETQKDAFQGPHPYDPYDDELTPERIQEAYGKLAQEEVTNGVGLKKEAEEMEKEEDNNNNNNTTEAKAKAEETVTTRYGEVILPKEEIKLGEECWGYIAPGLQAGDTFCCGGETFKIECIVQKEVPVKLDSTTVVEERRLNKAKVTRVPTPEDQKKGSPRSMWDDCQIQVKREVHEDDEGHEKEGEDTSPKGSDAGSLPGTDVPEEATGGMTMAYPHVKAGNVMDSPISKERYYVVALGEKDCDTECLGENGDVVVRKMHEAFVRPFADGPPPSWEITGRPDALEEAQVKVVLNASRLEGGGGDLDEWEQGAAAMHEQREDAGSANGTRMDEPLQGVNMGNQIYSGYGDYSGAFWCKAGNCHPRKTVDWPNWDCYDCHRNKNWHYSAYKGQGKAGGKKGGYGPVKGGGQHPICCFFARFGHCRKEGVCAYPHQYRGNRRQDKCLLAGEMCDRMVRSHPGFPCRHHTPDLGWGGGHTFL